MRQDGWSGHQRTTGVQGRRHAVEHAAGDRALQARTLAIVVDGPRAR